MNTDITTDITFKPNTIDATIFNEKEYSEYLLEYQDTIFNTIKEVLGKKITGYTLEELNKFININPRYLNHTLSIWNKFYCTFYAMYGRVIYNTKNNRWYYIYTQNPNSRKQIVTLNDIISDSLNYN